MAIRITSLNHRLNTSTGLHLDELHVSEKRWFAVRTSHKHEKRAAAELRKAGVEVFLPIREKVSHYPTKTVVKQLPLLSSYVFVRIVLREERTVRNTPFTAGFVRLGRDRKRVSDREIELLRLISTDRNLGFEEVSAAFDFSKGTLVEIISGPMAGVRGRYVQKKSKKAFVISLVGGGALLGTCEIDPRMLAPVTGVRG